MGFKEIIQNIGSKSKERKALFKQMQEQDRLELKLEEMKKSSNQRELERYIKEEQEKTIREQLEFMRKKRQKEIAFGSNPLNVKNITNHTDWEVMKEKNMFKQKGNIFTNLPSVLKSNNKLMNSGNVLKEKYLFKKGGYTLK
jgi:hypothetical protein